MKNRKEQSNFSRLTSHLPYLSVAFLATAALGASVYRQADRLLDFRPFPGLSRNEAMQKAKVIGKRLMGAPLQITGAWSGVRKKAGSERDFGVWDITGEAGQDNYSLQIDAETQNLICLLRDKSATSPQEESLWGERTGDLPGDDGGGFISKTTAARRGALYLAAAGLASQPGKVKLERIRRDNFNGVWDAFYFCQCSESDTIHVRMGIACRSGELRRMQVLGANRDAP